MSKFFFQSKTRSKRVKSKKIFSAMKANLKIINIILSVFVLTISVSYLIQINSLATKGYKIKELEGKILELKDKKNDLELESLSLQSMGTVKEKVDGLGLVAVNNPDYLTPTPVAFAR